MSTSSIMDTSFMAEWYGERLNSPFPERRKLYIKIMGDKNLLYRSEYSLGYYAGYLTSLEKYIENNMTLAKSLYETTILDNKERKLTIDNAILLTLSSNKYSYHIKFYYTEDGDVIMIRRRDNILGDVKEITISTREILNMININNVSEEGILGLVAIRKLYEAIRFVYLLLQLNDEGLHINLPHIYEGAIVIKRYAVV